MRIDLDKDIALANKLVVIGQQLQHSTPDPKLKQWCFEGVFWFDKVVRALNDEKSEHISGSE